MVIDDDLPCAKEADAIGSFENESNISSGYDPNSSHTVSRIS